MYTIIKTNKDLKNICKYIKDNSTIIAIDTEFMRKYTYFPILCLIQVAYYNENKIIESIIIDPLEKNLNLDPFVSILKNNKIKKIIHSCSQDLDAFYTLKQTKLKNFEDTQIMMEFCGTGTLSYTNSLQEFLHIDLFKNKKIQVSNWKKRPLSKKQLKYASNDVNYLIQLYDCLKEKLNDNYDRYLNEMKYIQKQKEIDYIVENSWKKMKFLIHKETYLNFLLIKDLAKWREHKAFEENIIRNSILSDDLLYELVKKKPKDIKELKANFFVNQQILAMPKCYRNEIINIIIEYNKKYKNVENEEIIYIKEKNFPYKNQLALIQEKIEEIASSKNILFSRTLTQYEIIALIMKYENKRKILYGWKYELFNEEIYKLTKNNPYCK